MRLVLDRGSEYGCFVRDFYGNNIEVPRSKFKGLSPREGRFTPAEIWELSLRGRQVHLGAKNQSRVNPDLVDRPCLQIDKLFEFGYLRLDCRGYFHNGKTDVRDSFASGLLFGVYLCVDDGAGGNEIETGPPLLAWCLNPCTDTWAAFRATQRGQDYITVERECSVTGYRFRWSFDGVVGRPTHRPVRGDELTPDEKAWSLAPLPDGSSLPWARPVWREIDDFPYPDGNLPAMTLDLGCPTGKLVFANCLFDVFGEGDIFRFDINSEAGKEQQSRHLLGLGAWHVFACGLRAIYQNGNSIQIGEWMEGGRIDPPQAPWIERGDVCGDLRWFYGCDEGALPAGWQSKLAHKDEKLVRISVEPGRYRLTNYEPLNRPDGTLCVIEKIS